MFGVVIIWIALSVVAGIGAKNKGRSGVGYFFLSIFLSPLVGLLAMAVAKPIEEEKDKEKKGEDEK